MNIDYIPKPSVPTDAAHSKYSPSGSKRWINCPASIQMEIALDRPKEIGESFYAKEGTAAHELSEHCLSKDVDAIKFKGVMFNDLIVDLEMCKQVQKYIDYVRGNVTWDSQLWVENRISLEFLKEDIFGTADSIIVRLDETEILPDVFHITALKGELEIIDLKYGKGVIVEPEDNTQLMMYAIGVLAHLFHHGIKFHPGFDVKLTIVQPRAPHAKGIVRSTYVTVAQLKDFKEIVLEAIRQSELEDPPFGPGEEQCRWCPSAPVCSAYAKYNLGIAQIEFEEFKKSTPEFKKSLADANRLSDNDIANILNHTKSIEQWLNSITEYAIEQLRASKQVKGYKLVYGRSNRAWESQSEVERILLEYGTDEERLYTKKFISPAQAEKELTDSELELVENLIVKPTGGITLAKETDGRPAVNVNEEAKRDWNEEEL